MCVQQWVPKEISPAHIMQHKGQTLVYHKMGFNMLQGNVTVDRSWVHYYQPEFEHASIQ